MASHCSWSRVAEAAAERPRKAAGPLHTPLSFGVHGAPEGEAVSLSLWQWRLSYKAQSQPLLSPIEREPEAPRGARAQVLGSHDQAGRAGSQLSGLGGGTLWMCEAGRADPLEIRALEVGAETGRQSRGELWRRPCATKVERWGHRHPVLRPLAARGGHVKAAAISAEQSHHVGDLRAVVRALPAQVRANPGPGCGGRGWPGCGHLVVVPGRTTVPLPESGPDNWEEAWRAGSRVSAAGSLQAFTFRPSSRAFWSQEAVVETPCQHQCLRGAQVGCSAVPGATGKGARALGTTTQTAPLRPLRGLARRASGGGLRLRARPRPVPLRGGPLLAPQN